MDGEEAAPYDLVVRSTKIKIVERVVNDPHSRDLCILLVVNEEFYIFI